MTCNEIENLLPAYREDVLSPEERKIISGHLASCPRCGRALTSLKNAEALVQGLREVEPPPFFEQRIMSRVRQEAGRKKGILRRLFYPLHVKIPIQALATLVIAVLAFHVYQGGDPEMKQMAPLPVPLTDPGKSQIAAEAPGTLPAPSVTAPVKRSPAKDLPEKDQQRFVTPPLAKGGKEEKATDSQAAIRQEHPSAMKPADPPIPGRAKEALPVGEVVLKGIRDEVEKRDTDKASFPQEQKSKTGMSDTGAGVGESAKVTAAAPLKRQPVIGLTIWVGDSALATREIETRLGRVNARIIERQNRKGGEFMKVEVASQNLSALMDQLKAIGRIDPDTIPPVVPEGGVTVIIKIVAHP